MKIRAGKERFPSNVDAAGGERKLIYLPSMPIARR